MSFFDDELDTVLRSEGVEVYPLDPEDTRGIMVSVVIDGTLDQVEDVSPESDAEHIVRVLAEHLRTHGLGENFNHVCVDAYERSYGGPDEEDTTHDRIAIVEHGE